MIRYLLPDLEYRGHARQAALLAGALPRERFAIRVTSLQGDGPFAEPLRAAGAPVGGHPGRRLFDVEDWSALRNDLITEKPALIHVWGTRALRALWWASLFRRAALPSVVVSLSSAETRPRGLRWWDRRLLSRVRAVVVSCDAERAALVAGGFPTEKVRVIPPGLPVLAEPDQRTLRAANGIPADVPILMAVGHLGGRERAIDAVWAFEIVQFASPRARLLIVGAGPNRPRLMADFHTARTPENGVEFLGARADAATLIGLADVALVVHRRAGGTFTCLDAMAAGRPVIATGLPHLAALVRDGETGLLVRPGDQPAIARSCLRLLEDAGRRRALGDAGRERVAGEFRVETMAERFVALYAELS
jgi:glycosyltransferase involved in cell wall biosynthesis